MAWTKISAHCPQSLTCAWWQSLWATGDHRATVWIIATTGAEVLAYIEAHPNGPPANVRGPIPASTP